MDGIERNARLALALPPSRLKRMVVYVRMAFRMMENMRGFRRG